MEWTNEDKAFLMAFKKNVDCDDVKIKEKIKQVLLNDKYIIHVLNNKELEDKEAEIDDYFGINILPYYMVTPTQCNVQNFLCYEISYDEVGRYNSSIKKMQVIFYIICEQKNLVDKETGIARHDLLAALVQNRFNHTNYFGSKLELISDVPSVVDTDYAARTLIFEQKAADNNIFKTRNGVTYAANKGLPIGVEE